MLLTVKLFATFRDGRFEVAEREFPDGSTVGDVVDALAIARDQVGVVMVGGRHVELDDRPRPGSTLAIFPLVGGG